MSVKYCYCVCIYTSHLAHVFHISFWALNAVFLQLQSKFLIGRHIILWYHIFYFIYYTIHLTLSQSIWHAQYLKQKSKLLKPTPPSTVWPAKSIQPTGVKHEWLTGWVRCLAKIMFHSLALKWTPEDWCLYYFHLAPLFSDSYVHPPYFLSLSLLSNPWIPKTHIHICIHLNVWTMKLTRNLRNNLFLNWI